MILRNSRLPLCIFLTLFSLIFSSVGDWNSLYSTITTNDIVTSGDSLIILSDYAVSIHDIGENNIEFYSSIEGVQVSEISTIEYISNRVWIGGAGGEVEVYDPNTESSHLINHLSISMNVNNINNITFFGETMVSSYSSDDRSGILLFDIDSSGYPDYRDYVDEFSDYYPSIVNDITISDEKIFVASDEGIFSALLSDNLKFSDSWELVGTDPIDVTALLVLSEVLYAATDQSLLYFPDLSLSPNNAIDVSFTDQLIEIGASDSDNIYMLYKNNLLHIELDAGTYTENQIWSIDGSEYTSMDVSQDRIAAGMTNRGYMHISSSGTDYFQNNTMVLPSYSSITYLSDGSVAAVGYGGLLHYKDGIVINMIPESLVSAYQIDDISNSSLEIHSLNYEPGDFLPWSIVEYNNNKVMFSNSGINYQTSKRG